jgi:trigger factor
MAMQVNEIEYCKVNVHYTVEGDAVKDKISDTVRNLKKNKVRVPGYRPGKASDLAIRVHLKKHINEKVKEELVAQAYDDILFETKMKPIGYPQIMNSQLNGDNFLVDMLFLKKPEFELKGYKDLELPKPHMETTVENMTQHLLQQLREFHGDTMPYSETDFVQMGDQITMDVKVELDGKPMDSLAKEGVLYKVGERMFEGFDDSILGMTAGEERKFELVLGGLEGSIEDQKATFIVNIHMGTKKTPCPLDDTLAEKAGFKNFEELLQAATGRASGRMQENERNMLSQQVINKLLENNQFEVPAWLTNMEAQRLAQQNNVKLEEMGEEGSKYMVEQAEKQVRLSLILDSIRDAEPESVFSNQELINSMTNRLMQAGHTEQSAGQLLKQAERQGSLYGMMAQLKDEITLQWLVEHSKIVE